MYGVQYLLKDTLTQGFAAIGANPAVLARVLDGFPPNRLQEAATYLRRIAPTVTAAIRLSFPDQAITCPRLAIVLDASNESDQYIGDGRLGDLADPTTWHFTSLYDVALTVTCFEANEDQATILAYAAAFLLRSGRANLALPAYGQQIVEQTLGMSGVAPVHFDAGGTEGVFGAEVTFRAKTWVQYDEADTLITQIQVNETTALTDSEERLEIDVLLGTPTTN